MDIDRPAKPQGTQRRAADGYERRDAHPGWIFAIVAFLIVGGIFLQFMLGGFLKVLSKTEAPSDQWEPRSPPTPIARAEFPRLQVSPADDLSAFRAREENELNSYGWINRTAGVVRIPIDRAMDLLLERGLPARTGSNTDKTGPSSYELQMKRPMNRETGGQQ